MSKLPKIVGYAAVWSAVSNTPKEGYWRRFACGAFSDSIATDGIYALFKHDWDFRLASNFDGSSGLNLREDGKGLAFEIEPYEDKPWIALATSYIRDGSIRGMSCGYVPLEWHGDRLASGLVVCTITRAKLLEISPVYAPLFKETSVRLVEPAPAKALAAAPPASPGIYREVIRIDPALVSRPRRHVRAGAAMYC